MHPKLPLRFRVAGFLLSRAEFVHRELRDFYRTPLGSAMLKAAAYLVAGFAVLLLLACFEDD